MNLEQTVALHRQGPRISRWDLQAGLQEFQGHQVEQMVRFLEPSLGDRSRIRQQLVLEGLFQQHVPALNRDLGCQSCDPTARRSTPNLSTGLTLSLLSAGNGQSQTDPL